MEQHISTAHVIATPTFVPLSSVANRVDRRPCVYAVRIVRIASRSVGSSRHPGRHCDGVECVRLVPFAITPLTVLCGIMTHLHRVGVAELVDVATLLVVHRVTHVTIVMQASVYDSCHLQ